MVRTRLTRSDERTRSRPRSSAVGGPTAGAAAPAAAAAAGVVVTRRRSPAAPRERGVRDSDFVQRHAAGAFVKVAGEDDQHAPKGTLGSRRSCRKVLSTWPMIFASQKSPRR